MQITGGKVVFGRSVQPAQYETKKAEVEITFSFAEGENLEGKLDLAASIAQDKALEMVGLKKPSANAKADAVVATVTEALKPGKTKADLEKEKLAALEAEKPAPTKKAATPPKAEKPQISTGDERKDPAQEPDPFTVPAEKPAGVQEEDPFSVPAADITDDKLLSELQAANSVLKDPVTLRGLITKYVGKTPCKAVDIPQGARTQFIADLHAAVAAKKAILK